MTFILPTDFSATATNAAIYATKMLQGIYDARLLLYHAYGNSMYGTSVQKSLNLLKDRLMDVAPIKIEYYYEQTGDFIGSLEQLARRQQAQAIIMGINGRTKLEQKLMDSNSLEVVERKICPVIIVPPNATFSPVKNVALACEFKNVVTTVPTEQLKSVLELFHPKLHIVNVDSEQYITVTEDVLVQRNTLLEMFQDFNPEFHFITTYNFTETITQFVKDYAIDILITIPRRHSFFAQVFKTRNTKKLAFESPIPILAAHE
ncbi:MAG: universal stress protein [Flavisolibacter sp.]|nr:universal stress protein [Flavisolibacter sp.]